MSSHQSLTVDGQLDARSRQHSLCMVVLEYRRLGHLEGTEYLSDTPKAFGLQRTRWVRWSPLKSEVCGLNAGRALAPNGIRIARRASTRCCRGVQSWVPYLIRHLFMLERTEASYEVRSILRTPTIYRTVPYFSSACRAPMPDWLGCTSVCFALLALIAMESLTLLHPRGLLKADQR